MKKLFLPLMIVLFLALAACGTDPNELVDQAGDAATRLAAEAGDVAATAAAVATDIADGPDNGGSDEAEATAVPTEEPTEVPTEVPTEEPTAEPTVEVAEGESPIWAEIKSETLQDPVVLTGLVLDDASVTQQDGSALLSDGFEFYYGDVNYHDSHPLLAIQAGDGGTAIILNTLTTALDDVFAPIAKSSETTLGAAAVQALYTSSFAYKLVSIGGTNEPVMEGDLVEVTLGDSNSSEPPYFLMIYRGENRELIAKFQLVKK